MLRSPFGKTPPNRELLSAHGAGIRVAGNGRTPLKIDRTVLAGGTENRTKAPRRWLSQE